MPSQYTHAMQSYIGLKDLAFWASHKSSTTLYTYLHFTVNLEILCKLYRTLLEIQQKHI